jgi:hypothetical protein
LKIRADEHVSPKIVRAVQSLVLSAGWEISHVRDLHSARTADETWIPQFALEGGEVILSADRKMLARPHQLAAIAESGLICVFFSTQWAQAKRHEQAAQILHWWPCIEKTLIESKPKDCWKVPSGYGEGKLVKIAVNFEKAAKANKSSQ